MLKRIERYGLRRLAWLGAAGMLFQAGGCQINTDEIVGGFVTSALTQFINSVVFAAFNLAP